jgi:hypothetical protein
MIELIDKTKSLLELELVKSVSLAQVFMWHSDNCDFHEDNPCDCGFISAKNRLKLAISSFLEYTKYVSREESLNSNVTI